MEFLPDCPTLEPLIAATPAVKITIGGRFPDGTHCDAGNILIGSGEADSADTLFPQLMVAGADRRRLHEEADPGGVQEGPRQPAQGRRERALVLAHP